MSPIPPGPSSKGDAELVMITLLNAHIPEDWSIRVARASSVRPMELPLITVQQVSSSIESQSFDGGLWQEDTLIDIKVWASSMEEKSRMRELVKRICLDHAEVPGQDYSFIAMGPTRDLDSLSQSEGLYADNITINLIRFLEKNGG